MVDTDPASLFSNHMNMVKRYGADSAERHWVGGDQEQRAHWLMENARTIGTLAIKQGVPPTVMIGNRLDSNGKKTVLPFDNGSKLPFERVSATGDIEAGFALFPYDWLLDLTKGEGRAFRPHSTQERLIVLEAHRPKGATLATYTTDGLKLSGGVTALARKKNHRVELTPELLTGSGRQRRKIGELSLIQAEVSLAAFAVRHRLA